VKAFIFEDIPLFHAVTFVKTPGASPVAVFYDKFDEEVHRFPLSEMSREGCNEMLLSRGFFKRSHKDEEVPKEYLDEGTVKTEL